MNCRHCKTELEIELIDLGVQPPSNSYLKPEDLNKAELFLPLKVYVCSKCFLVQTADYTERETFFNEDYAYFSSTSQSWLRHAGEYVDNMIEKFKIDSSCFVIEVASNDGYLLRNFVNKKVPCLGIEPTKSTAEKSASFGVNTLVEFYGVETARKVREEYGGADLITCNNVYAHVPDINDFTQALEISLSNDGIVTIEFPHLLKLIELCQFDTIYHEHFSYLSVSIVHKIFAEHNLRIFDVEELTTHGGSVRVYGCKKDANFDTSKNVPKILKIEKNCGLTNIDTYLNFKNRAFEIKNNFIMTLLQLKNENKSVCGYGAAAKGNTLLNFAGVREDLLPFVVDAADSKIGKFLPGSRIPIIAPSALKELEPDCIIVFPWNLADEIRQTIRHDLGLKSEIITVAPEMAIL